MYRPNRILLLLMAPVPLVFLTGAKPSPPPTSFVPAAAYIYAGSAGQDLRLSDEAGATAVLLHRSSGYLMHFDLGPGSSRSAVLVESTGNATYRLVLRTWAQSAPGASIVVGPPSVLHEAVNIYYPDFSPDGTKVAFVEWEGAGSRFSLRTIDVATGGLSTIASGVENPYYLRWSHDGAALYYASQPSIAGAPYTAYRHPVDGNEPTRLFEKLALKPWDISRDNTDRLITSFSEGGSLPLATWDGTNLERVYSPLTGSSPHYSCGNAKVLYQSATKTGKAGAFRVLAPAHGTLTTFTSDPGVKAVDWIPCG